MKKPGSGSLRALGAVSAFLLGIVSASAFRPPTEPGLPNFDKRSKLEAKGLPSEASQRAAISNLTARVPNAKIVWDEVLSTPKWVNSVDAFLSGSNGQGNAISARTARTLPPDEPHRAVKGFLQEHAALIGHDASVLTTARIKQDFVTPHNGMRTVVWEQQLDGIPVFEGLLVAHTTKNGELVNISCRFVPSVEEAANRGVPNRANLQGAPLISAQQAIVNAALNLGEKLAIEAVTAAPTPGGQRAGMARFVAAPVLNGETVVGLTWLPLDRRTLRLCWEVLLTSRKRGEMFRALVDVETGEVLLRRCLTTYLSNASYRVYVSDSPSPFSPGHPSPATNQPPLVPRVLVVTNAVNTNASPSGWINDGVNETQGNNVDAHLDRNADDLPDLPRPQGSPVRVFDFPLDLNQSPLTYGDASVVQLFYWCNWMHDKLYELGFTEAAGNFQVNNFGRGGVSGDPVQADAQDGSGFDNANMSTPPDGYSPRLQMYLWSGPHPNRDGALDAEIVLHEYTHGLSNRRVGGGVGISQLQSAGMGEGWSDFYALTLLSEAGDNLNGNYAAAAYSTFQLSPGFMENYYFGIRRYPYSTDLAKNPLTFKDIDPAQIDPHSGIPLSPVVGGGGADEVHNQGEVWCVTLWEARANLIKKYGFQSGNRLILQLVTDGMNLSPADPNFVQARDAILQADRTDNAGANANELWAAFAKRGMGFSASSPDSSTTAGVDESFDVPDDLLVTPISKVVFSGPAGGPFLPAAQSYSLSNVSTNPVVWRATNSGGWLALSKFSGTIPAGAAPQTLQVAFTPLVSLLPAGIYSDAVVFTNSTTGRTQSRKLVLRVGQPDYFTEVFNPAQNDLQYQTLTFTPDGSASFYSVCRDHASSFPSDPRDGKAITLMDDDFTQITLAGNARVSLYGKSNSVFYIGSNGYITFDQGDYYGFNSLLYYFFLPRISAFYDDLDPTAGGTISWQQAGDRVAVTFQNVPEFLTTNSNSFQMEMFYDGRIRLTHLGMAALHGTVGLSAGHGVPSGFLPSDLDSYGACSIPLKITLPPAATEGDGTLSGQGLVSVPVAPGSSLIVSLTSSDTTKLIVPATVVIPSGQTSAAFDLTIVDDSYLDGTRVVIVTGSAPSYASGSASMMVHDNEQATLTVALPPSIPEGAGSVQGTVSVSAPVPDGVVVFLHSSDDTKVRVPAAIFIPAGSLSITFTATIIDELWIEGLDPVQITAHVENWVDGVATLSVIDNENLNLTLTVPAQASEAGGLLANAGLVAISGLLPTNLVVSLSSSDPTRVTVPATATIFPGQTNGTFSLAMVDNALIDGNHLITLTASAPGWVDGTATIEVIDDETPPAPANPTPADLSSNNPVTVGLAWTLGPNAGGQIENGGFETGDFTGWTIDTPGNGVILINDGTFVPYSGDGPTAPYAGSYSVLMTQYGPGLQALHQDVFIPLNTTGATLSWVDRIRNFGSNFGPNQQFRVEVRDLNNDTLAVVFTTQPGDALLADWVQRSADLSGYRGQTLRLAFIVDPEALNLDVHLDEVSLVSGSTTNDVYFGTNPLPGAAEFQGSTTNNSWPLPRLAPLTTYYWQIVSRKVGQTAGPVWQFGTLGVDHLQWSGVPSPQRAQEPFAAALAAKDAFGTTVSNFSGVVVLSAQPAKADVTVGSGTDSSVYPMPAFFETARSQVIYLSNEVGAARSISALALNVLSIPGQTLGHWTIRMKHTTLSAYLSPAWEANNWTTVFQQDQVVSATGWVYFAFSQPFNYNGNNNLAIDFSFNDSFFTFDGECQATKTLLPRSLNFSSDGQYGDPLSWSGSSAPAPYANLEVPNIKLSALAPPVPLTPSSSGPFVNGVWNGNLTVLSAGTSVQIKADDGHGHIGFSNPFDVVLANDLLITGSDYPDPVDLNSVLTYSLTASSTGPLDATGVTVSDNLPPGVVFLSATPSQGTCTNLGGQVTCALGTLPPGRSATINIRVTSPPTAGSITNQASVAKNEPDPNLANNSVSQTTSVQHYPPIVQITSPFDGARFAFPADIPITAAASDSIGIRTVEFFDGSTRLGQSTASPFLFIWTNAAVGQHLLAARATDNLGVMSVSLVARVFVFVRDSITFSPPPGGWTYIYSGDEAIGGPKGVAVLDGSWDHNNGSSEWDGLGRGPGVGAPGGISTDGSSLTIEDAVAGTTGSNNNRSIYFTRKLADPGVANASRILEDGVTLSFRARLTPKTISPAAQIPLPNGYGIFGGGKGNFGLRQAGGMGGALPGIISFSLVRSAEDASPTNSIVFPQAGLTMNGLNGETPSAAVDSANRFQLQPLWSLPPLSRPYLSINGTERGLAYNPATSNLLVVTGSPALGGLQIEILNAASGVDAGTLATNGISGGTLVLNLIGVADDGVIYAANMVNLNNATDGAFKIYRWANESAAPVVAFSGVVNAPLRWGESFAVRGAGTNTQIIAGSGSASNQVAIFTTADGATFLPTVLNVVGAANGDFHLGLAFGSGDTFYGKQASGPLLYVSFDLAAQRAAVVQSYPAPGVLPGPMALFSVEPVQNLLAGVVASTNDGTPQSVNLYDLLALSATVTNTPLDRGSYVVGNPNPSGAGALAFGRGAFYVLDGNNGLLAFNLQAAPGLANLLPLDPAVFHEFWINIRAGDGTPGSGTHAVDIYLDGSLTPQRFNVTAGTGQDISSTTGASSYLALGCSSPAAIGAFDTDFFAYKAGLYLPRTNSPPVLAPVSDRTIHSGTTLTITNTATDLDVPPETLTFSLLAAPAGAVIDSSTGVFAWTPTDLQAPSTNLVTVRVSDDGLPSRSDQTSFYVTVISRPILSGASITNGAVTFSWSAIPGNTYRVQFKADLNDPHWTDLPEVIVPTGTVATKTDLLGASSQRFYRILVMP